MSLRDEFGGSDDENSAVPLERLARKSSIVVDQLKDLTKTDTIPAGDDGAGTGTFNKNVHSQVRSFVEKESKKNSALLETIRHICFLIIFIAAITLNRSSWESFLLNQAIESNFVNQQIAVNLQSFPTTFMGISSPQQYFQWLTSVVGAALDTNTFYDGAPMTPQQMDFISYSNRILGGVRVRQLRAAPNQECWLPHQLSGLTLIPDTCFSYLYDGGNADKTPFGPPSNETKYTYQSSDECGSQAILGNYLDEIDGGGFVVDFNLEDRDNGQNFSVGFQQLMNDGFIDVQSRAVVVTMNFLNLELESRIAVVYLVVEIPGDGQLFPFANIKTFRLNLYVSPLDYFRLVLEIFCLLFILYNIFDEGREMYAAFRTHQIKKYFFNFWNILEILDIVLYLVVIITYAQYVAAPSRYNLDLSKRTYFPELEQIASSAITCYNVGAVNVLISTFRTFKYLRLNNRLYLLWKALSHAGADLVGFLLIFLIITFGFIFMGWLAFGADIQGYDGFSNSFATCWNFLLGNPPDYFAMSASNRVLGPLFFTLFTIFIFFILANMFIAILSNSFNEVNAGYSKADMLAAISDKVEDVMRSLSGVYTRVRHKQGFRPKRSIKVLLEELQHPEILDNADLTREDIGRAIGPNALEEEKELLYTWIKKLESKRTRKAMKEAKETASKAPLTAEDEDISFFEDDNAAAGGNLSPSSTIGRRTFKRAPTTMAPADYNELRTSMRDLQRQVTEMKFLIENLVHRDGNNNNAGSSRPSSNNNNNNTSPATANYNQ